MGFIRRFTTDPGLDVLLEIESINIIDQAPPAAIQAVGSGTALLVGEFEKGPYATPTEVFGSGDFLSTFGGFGFSYAGVTGCNPCARSHKADNAVLAEYWNGNGFMYLSGRKFRRLILSRVDTSVGTVQLTRLGSITGANHPTYNLEPNQTVVFDIGSGNVTATFTATAATVTGIAFPGWSNLTGFTGGEYVDFTYDTDTTVRVVFLAADQTSAQVAARINAYMGFTFAAAVSTHLVLTARRKGTGSNITIAGVGGTLTALGLTAATTNGTGNVANIDAVTVAELHAVINAASASVNVTRNESDELVIYKNTTGGSITIDSTTTATDLGLPTEVAGDPAASVALTIPAGFRVRNAGAVEWVTCDDLAISADSAGPYSVKVRPAVDDGTTAGANANTVTTVPYQVVGSIFSVTNLAPLTAALTEAQLDVAYQTAIEKTIDLNGVAKEATIIYSARQSNAVRRALRQNAIDASSSGCYGRTCHIRPPLGTTRAVAKGSAEPGVGAYRHERVIYNFPGASVYVKEIAKRGTAGGAGFTADGVVNLGADGAAASVRSQLNPEENPGQATAFLTNVLGLETGTEYSYWTIDDYKSFKLKGIMALRIDDGVPVFQSGVTSVDPLVNPELVNISRRSMADMIQDSLALRAKNYSKKLNSRARRNAFVSDANTFLAGLKSKNKPELARIEDFAIDPNGFNTPTSLARGAYNVGIQVRNLSSLDAINLFSEIGEQVTISEV